ncbi:MAG: AIM24 family protein [Kouleothrix sp.]
MEYQIIGTTLQAVIRLDPGETVYSESGSMGLDERKYGYADQRARWRAGRHIQTRNLGRVDVLVEYTSQGGKGIVAFASSFPGKIVPLNLAAGQQMIAQKQAFLCAEKTVQMDIHFAKNSARASSKRWGFIMQKYELALAFVCLDGEIMEYTLGPGQMLKVDTPAT